MSFVSFVNNFLKPGFRQSFPRLDVSSESNEAIKPFLQEINQDDFRKNLIQAFNEKNVQQSPYAGIINDLVKQIQTTPTDGFTQSVKIFTKFKDEITKLIEYLKNSIKGLENITKIGNVLSELYPPKSDLSPTNMTNHYDGVPQAGWL
jgi:hypothetical protein